MTDLKADLKQKRANGRHRWKAVERDVAAALNKQLSGIGNYTPIKRIPLLGREGPDLTINETGLVINVKSRADIPDRMFPKHFQLLQFGDLVCFRVEAIHLARFYTPSPADGWKRLTDWWEFMDKWTHEFSPSGITAIVIHRPRMPIGHAGIVIKSSDLERLSCQIKTQSS